MDCRAKMTLPALALLLVLMPMPVGSADDNGLRLDYRVTVDDPSSRTAQVTLLVDGVAGDSFRLETSEFRGRFIAPQNLVATDKEGRQLPLAPTSDDEPTGLAWSIDMQGRGQVTVTYDVNPATVTGSDLVHGYISDQFGVAEGQTLFLVPSNKGVQEMDPTTEIARVAVRFFVPDGWEAHAPWSKEGEYYVPDLDGGRVLKHLCFAPIALGGFDFASRTISDTLVTVATYQGWDEETKERVAENAWKVFDYQAGVFGAGLGTQYLAVFSPRTDTGDPITTGEWSLGHTTWVQHFGDEDWFRWDLFSHGLFHSWNIWEPWGMCCPGSWFFEGSDVFYEMKVLANLRLSRPGEMWMWRPIEEGGAEPLDTSDLSVSVVNSGRTIDVELPLQELGEKPDPVAVHPLVIAAHDYEILDGFEPDWWTIPAAVRPVPLLATDPAGDSLVSEGGADLLALHGGAGEDSVVVRLDLAGPASSSQRYDLYFKSSADEMRQIGVSPSRGFADEVMARLQGDYDRYREEYAKTPRDVPLIDATDPFLVYRKSSMVVLEMAREIYERTEGNRTIDDLMHHLYEHFGSRQQLYDEEDVESALNLVTDSDFAPFFDAHIHGVTTLQFDWAFEDPDGDGLQSALEVLLETDGGEGDTDDDGVDDGVEVRLGTDPLDPGSRPKQFYLPCISSGSFPQSMYHLRLCLL